MTVVVEFVAEDAAVVVAVVHCHVSCFVGRKVVTEHLETQKDE